MKEFIVGFSKSKKKLPIASWLIRVYQGLSTFSHTYTKVRPRIFSTADIIHASEGKVLRMSQTQFDKRHETVKEFRFMIEDELYYDIMDEMHEASGDDYSVLQNVGIIYVDIMRLLGKRVANPFQTGWNCSEFVLLFLNKTHPTKFDHLDPQTVTPVELYKILKTL